MRDRRIVSLLRGIDPDDFYIRVSSKGIFDDIWDCQRAILLWATLKPTWNSLGFHLKNPFITLKDRLEILLEDNESYYDIVIGTWKGTTKDFLYDTPSPREIAEAKRLGDFSISKKDSSTSCIDML